MLNIKQNGMSNQKNKKKWHADELL